MSCCGGGVCIGCSCPVVEDLTFIKGDAIPIGKPVPDKQRVLVLEFWATTCPPCKTSIPHLSKLQQKYQDKEVYIIGITHEDVQTIRPFVDNMGDQMAYTVAIDTTGAANTAFPGSSIPRAYIIDHNNKVVFQGHPMDPKFENELQKAAAFASDKHVKVALPLITETQEQLSQRPIRELKHILDERGIRHTDCVEKSDLVNRILETCATVTYYM